VIRFEDGGYADAPAHNAHPRSAVESRAIPRARIADQTARRRT
jgi:hypothetical protein